MAIKALSMLNSEDKRADITYSVAAQTTTAVLTLLNGLAQGTTDVTRVGDDVRFKNLYLRGAWSHNGSGNDVQFGRIIIFRDNQTNGSAPSASDVLQTAADPFSPRNLDYSRRFKILYDQNVTLTNAGKEGIIIRKFFDFNKNKIGTHTGAKGYQHKTDYGLSNLGTVADISTGSYYVLTMADTATNGPFIRWTTRMRYIDN